MFEIQEECGLELIKQLVDGDKNMSRIYGFILYTDEDVHVRKMLADKLYWEELDKRSGVRWPIFTVRQLTKGHDETLPSSEGVSFIMKKWYEPATNMDVLNDFEIKSTEDLPCFVAFIWDDSETIQSVSVSIDGRSDSEVFNRVEEIISSIVRAESAVLPQYRQNVELFRNVKAELDGLNFRYKFKTITKAAKKFLPFLKLFI